MIDPISLSEAVETGDRRAVLDALRRKLIDAFAATSSARDLATLSRRIVELDQEIAALDHQAAEEAGYGTAPLRVVDDDWRQEPGI
jgi:hypothetical protein